MPASADSCLLPTLAAWLADGHDCADLALDPTPRDACADTSPIAPTLATQARVPAPGVSACTATAELGALVARCDLCASHGALRAARHGNIDGDVLQVPPAGPRPYLMRALAELLHAARAIDEMGELLRGYQQAAAGSPAALSDTDIARLLPDLAAYAAVHVQGLGDEAANRAARMDPVCGAAILRKALGLPAVPNASRFHAWLSAHAGNWAGILPYSASAPIAIVDFGSNASAIAAASGAENREEAERHYATLQRESGCEMAIGRWLERRVIYQSAAYRSAFIDGARRDCHLGVDLFMPAGTPLRLPMDGVVVASSIIDIRQDYGGMLVLAHSDGEGCQFHSLWGHLSHASSRRWSIGDRIQAGTEFAWLGDFDENGWWLPHLHFQLCLGHYDNFAAMPGVGEIDYADIWAELFPDPSGLLLRPR